MRPVPRRWWRVAGCVAIVGAAVLGGPGSAVAADPAGYVKYYQVAVAYEGKPEDLTEVATRFLDDANRRDDLFLLNEGRAQADGKTLTDRGQQLAAGWVLVMPWDAHGDGLSYGLPPAAAVPGAPPSTPPASPGADGGKSCATGSTPAGADPGWAAARLAPEQAWNRSQGSGVVVAVVDSGVDGTLPALSGRITAGSDVTADGLGRGDTDCLGSGTAMASVIAARGDGTVTGVAPEAAILPIRVVASSPEADHAKVATGIKVAAAAGASVIALGAYADLADPAVSEAVTRALDHDVVVVAPAAVGDGPAAPALDGLLRVGGVGPDGQPAGTYPQNTVDVTAPGIDVATLGPAGVGMQSRSGTQYAVAYVAGTAALVRAALPDLGPAEVAARIRETADPGGRSGPSPDSGWGLIDPAAAVGGPAGEAGPGSGSAGELAEFRTAVISLVIVVGLAAVGFLAWRSRRAGMFARFGAAPAGAGEPVDATSTIEVEEVADAGHGR